MAHGMPGLKQVFSKCKYTAFDRPKEWVPFGFWWDWSLVFMGVIHDRCHSWVPRRLKIFDASSRGLAETGGRSKVTQKPSE